MSVNFSGVTFANQRVTPSDDATLRRAIFSDGILSGCEFSYSGSTLTMSAGQLLICGRQIRHPTVQNWPVVDASTGYARLVLTVDLSRTSTKEAFDQVVDSIEYAASLDGFTEIVQTDINNEGSVYQIVACIVQLGTGGIQGIVSQLPRCSTAIDVLWQNASPDSEFPEQTINVPGIGDIEKYQYIMITSRRASVFKDNAVGATNLGYYSMYPSGRIVMDSREIYLGNGTVEFGDNHCAMIEGATSTVVKANTNNRPVAIVGFKGAV